MDTKTIDKRGDPERFDIHSMPSVDELGSRSEFLSLPSSTPTASDMAFATSGSPGHPMGVILCHSNLTVE